MSVDKIKDEIRIERVWGTDKRLYELIGPFVMDPAVIKMNGGYPFKNTEDHVWYIAIRGKNLVMGFISIVDNKLCNDFTWQDYDLLKRLINQAISGFKAGTVISFMAEHSDISTLEKLGFVIEREGVKYSKMIKKI